MCAKKAIKAVFKRIPFGLESKAVVQIIEYLFRPSYDSLIRLRAKIRAQAIKAASKNTAVKDFIICFDLSVSALGLGEVLYSVMLARYLELHQKNVRFVFIKDKLRDDFSAIYSDITSFEKQFEAMRLIADTLLDTRYSRVQCLSWKDFEKSIEFSASEKCTSFVIMEDRVRLREPIYNHMFNTLNWMLSYESDDFIDKFLLNYDQLSRLAGISKPCDKYVTFCARYSLRWGVERNLTLKNLKDIYFYLSKVYPSHKIMLVSDNDGCEYYKKLAHKEKLDIIFSKSYSPTFLGDGALILGSAYYLQFLGGGIGVVAMFSRVPYEITSLLANEKMWSKSKFMYWQSELQKFNPNKKFNF